MNAPQYLQARSLAAGGQTDAALVQLEAWSPRTPAERAQRHWALAVLHRGEGRHAAALPHLEAVVALRPGVPRFRMALADSLEALGQRVRARHHRARADPARATAAPDPRWSGQFRFAIVPETNPAQRTSAERITVAGLPATINPNARAKAATGVAFGARGAFQPVVAPGVQARFALGVRGEVFEGDVPSDVTLDAEAGLIRRLPGNLRIEGALTYARRWIDGASYSEGPGLRAGLVVPSGDRARLTMALAVQQLSHPGNAALDGPRSIAYLGYDYAVSPDLVLRGALRFERASTPTPSASFTAASVSIGGTYAFRGGLVMGLDLELRAARHDGRAPLFADVREERRETLRLRVLHSRVSWRGFAPVFEVGFERQRSTIPLYDYENASTSIGLTRSF